MHGAIPRNIMSDRYGFNGMPEQGPMKYQDQSESLGSMPPMPLQHDKTRYMEPKARMRVSKACDRCRTQKIKCSGTFPCTTCLKHKKDCIYNSPPGSSGKPGEYVVAPTILNAPTEKELPYITKSDDKSYIRHLENRIQYLESRLGPDSEHIGSTVNAGEPDDESVARYVNPSAKWRYSRRSQVLLIQELCKTTYDQLSDENKETISLPRHQYFGWNLSGTLYLSPEPLPELPEFAHPIEPYIEYFFKEINLLFAIIHESVFRQQLKLYQELASTKAGVNVSSPFSQTKLFEAMLYLMVALSIRFTEFSKEDLSLDMLKEEEKLFKYCHKVVSILSFQWESFELIQCWLLITLYLRITHRQTSYFTSLGSAANMCTSMGIYRNSSKHRLPGTIYEELKAKRIFYAFFIFERLFGLQSGRYDLIAFKEVELEFPDFDYKIEKNNDNWVTLPALALLHISRIATFVHTAAQEKLDIVKYQQVNKELITLNKWLNDHGFDDKDLFSDPNESISSLVKSQVKLHYYDLVMCIHGKVLFNFLGRRIATPGLKVEMVLDSSRNVIDILSKVHGARLLYVPWYLNLLLLFHVGVNFLTLINSGLFLAVAKENYTACIDLLEVLKHANVKHGNKVIIKKRFKMAEECLWALTNAAKILSVRFQQDQGFLNDVGTDPGSALVNQATFGQYGLYKQDEEFSEILRTGRKRKSHEPQNNKKHAKASKPEGTPDISPHDPSYTNLDQNMYDNLTWFDQFWDDTLMSFPTVNPQ